jgi:uncharacterized LabA/DUF88 family protein
MNMTTKVNVLIDGGFFHQRFFEINKKNPSHTDVIKEVDNVMTLVRKKTNGETNDILLRIYYYDCKPFGEKVKRPDGTEMDFSASRVFAAKNNFLKNLCKEEKMALRIGELSFDGWKTDPHNPNIVKPDFKQKGVDMKVGLDMAWMATKKIVDKIVLIAGDSDFVSPIKFVRKEGLQVYLYTMKHFVKETLIEHCDFILS